VHLARWAKGLLSAFKTVLCCNSEINLSADTNRLNQTSSHIRLRQTVVVFNYLDATNTTMFSFVILYLEGFKRSTFDQHFKFY
jgi:hypothetical protein